MGFGEESTREVINEAKHFEHVETFAEGFQKVLCNLDEIRKRYPKAYERWTPDEDAQLRAKYQEGIEIDDLAVYFERQPSAICSRLAKLGLLPAKGSQAK